jgi:hypothetical protein
MVQHGYKVQARPCGCYDRPIDSTALDLKVYVYTDSIHL